MGVRGRCICIINSILKSCSGYLNCMFSYGGFIKMVKSCAAFGCTERYIKGSNISFHSFPTDEVRRGVWTLALKRENFRPNDYTVLCSKHFSPECFDTEAFGIGRKLKPDAVPSIFDFPPHLAHKSKKRKVTCKKRHLLPKMYMQYKDLLENDTCKKSGDFADAVSRNLWEHDHGLYPKQSRTDPDEIDGAGQDADPVHSPDSRVTATGSDPGSDTDEARGRPLRQRRRGSSRHSPTDVGHGERGARKRDRSPSDAGESECGQKRPEVFGPHLEHLPISSRLHLEYPFPDEPVDVNDMLDIKEEPFPEEELPMENIDTKENIEQRLNMCTTLLNADCYGTVKIKQEKEEYPITVKYEMIDTWLVTETGVQ